MPASTLPPDRRLSLALEAAADAAGAQDFPAGALYVVATPIGNLADITLRALHVLARVDRVACEDTRTSGALLRHFGIERPLLALHEHNERAAAASVCAYLAAGKRVAYVSDAGTPAVSDPGAALVAAVVAAGHRVLPLPGPSSASAAVSVAGDTGAQGFVFAGFLPGKAQEREQALARWRRSEQSVVVFEAPHRIEALARALAADEEGADRAVPRQVTICRELTKQFEQVLTLPLTRFPEWLAADPNHLRGEFVLVLHATGAERLDADALPDVAARTLKILVRDLPLAQAAALAAELTGVPRKRLYAQALAWKDAAP
ncbi:MAG TPA: 16S rRNA (cytidine(1402)-2'-O)-methyltransferase [Burkholderiaceae bacterium]|nr:16S rRNA (cytidine(1402)-2'-O)-methyltransferase [Burkholderiaceae bacterium]